MTAEVLLDVKDLSISIQSGSEWKPVVKSLSFQLHKNETLGIVGESGCGKSLTAQAIMRLLPHPHIRVTEGSILFNGQDILTLSTQNLCALRGNDIAMIFQEPMTALNPVISIGQQIFEQIKIHRNLLTGPENQYSTKNSIKRKVIELLIDVGIDLPEQRYNSYPHQLSGGMRQRVMIAMALSCKPQLIIADEPTTALDVSLQNQILSLLKALQHKYHTSLIFISHDLAVVAQVCQRTLIMYEGEILEQGSIDSIFRKPDHPYSKSLLLCSPSKSHQPRAPLPSITKPVSPLANLEDKRHYFDKILSEFENKQLDNSPLTMGDFDNNQSNRNTILSIHEIHKHFEIKRSLLGFNKQSLHAVNNISFSLLEGKTLGIVGTSGSGKSTLARIISGIEKADQGTIYFKHNEITPHNRNKTAREIQYVFQDAQESLNSRLTIKEILLESLIIHKVGSPKERLETAKESLLLVGLNIDLLMRYPHELSGGQKQRIGIARSLMLKPKLLICDEPVSALDVSVQAQVLNLLNELQKKLNLSLIIITHDLFVVRHMADNILVMNQGEMVEYGDAISICDQPQEKYTQQLIASTPTWPIKNNALALD